MPEVLISKELVTLSIPDNLIPAEQYDEIVKDIRLQYEMELAEAACDRQEAEIEYLQSDEYFERCIEIAEAQAEQEQARIDAEQEYYPKLLEAIAEHEQAQIDAWDIYLDKLIQGEYIDITSINSSTKNLDKAVISITEKEISIEEIIEEIPLGTKKTLIFGKSIGTKGVVVSNKQWESFLVESVTKRFPDGYNKVNSEGVWKEGNENSANLSFVCPDTIENKNKLLEIAKDYCTRFNQDAVIKINADGKGYLLQIKKGEANA